MMPLALTSNETEYIWMLLLPLEVIWQEKHHLRDSQSCYFVTVTLPASAVVTFLNLIALYFFKCFLKINVFLKKY